MVENENSAKVTSHNCKIAKNIDILKFTLNNVIFYQQLSLATSEHKLPLGN